MKELADRAEIHGLSDLASRARQRLRDREQPLLVMVVGEGNFGKSSLINALLGRQVAPVSRLDKTWKVDIYTSCTDGEERALLYWRGGHTPEVEFVTVQHAREVCAEHERVRRTRRTAKGTWKSDLWQVRWELALPWLPRSVALVDTPGFSQFRGDTTVREVALYGGKGIVISAEEDPFHYYYYRADLVLWCLKATRLQDRDTLDMLNRVRHYGKRVIGVLTFMDRIPSERWGEILKEAQRLYGEFVDEFLPCAAGSRHEDLKQKSILDLRGALQCSLGESVEKEKLRADTFFLDSAAKELVRALDEAMSCYIENFRIYSSSVHALEQLEKTVTSAAKSRIDRIWEGVKAKLTERLDALWDRSGEEPRRFFQLVQSETREFGAAHAKVQSVLAESASRLESDCIAILTNVAWIGRRVGETSCAAFSVTAIPTIPELRGLQISDSIEFSSTGAEGVGAGIVAGAGAAILGALALGPVGLVAGLGGLVVGAIARRSESISKAESQIETYCKTQMRTCATHVQHVVRDYFLRLLRTLEDSFCAHVGFSPSQMAEKTFEADRTLDCLGAWPEERPRVLMPALDDHQSQPRYSLYFLQLARGDCVLRRKWDAAVLAEWRRQTAPVLENALLGEEGPFSTQRMEADHRRIERLVVERLEQRIRKAGVLVVSGSDVMALGASQGFWVAVPPSMRPVVDETATQRLRSLQLVNGSVVDADQLDAGISRIVEMAHRQALRDQTQTARFDLSEAMNAGWFYGIAAIGGLVGIPWALITGFGGDWGPLLGILSTFGVLLLAFLAMRAVAINDYLARSLPRFVQQVTSSFRDRFRAQLGRLIREGAYLPKVGGKT